MLQVDVVLSLSLSSPWHWLFTSHCLCCHHINHACYAVIDVASGDDGWYRGPWHWWSVMAVIVVLVVMVVHVIALVVVVSVVSFGHCGCGDWCCHWWPWWMLMCWWWLM